MVQVLRAGLCGMPGTAPGTQVVSPRHLIRLSDGGAQALSRTYGPFGNFTTGNNIFDFGRLLLITARQLECIRVRQVRLVRELRRDANEGRASSHGLSSNLE